jgi:iron complex transport system substrate-binding protein
VPYFEEVSFRPDYLLADYIMLLHPDLPRRPLRYYRALTD